MCGIAGYAGIGTDIRVDSGHIAAMLDSLDHRGPDDNGFVDFPQLVMGNTRLSIIDVSGGRQPISNEDDTVFIVYNGETYNAPELRRELVAKGHIFKTHSDTEVLLHLYEEEGAAFLKRLNGMFTVSIYDKNKNEILIARDRFGVKPLYWFQRDGILAWASEIKALKVLPEFDSKLSPEGLSTFLGLMYIPDPWTAYEHVHKLRPGHFIRSGPDGVTVQQYYDFDFGAKDDITSAAASSRLATLLRGSVERQMLSDVPVGVLLSGGLDSRSVLAAAAEQSPGLPSFTIAFDDERFDEGGAAAAWAKSYGSENHRHKFDEDDFCDRLLGRQKHQDEPYGLWCQVAVESLSQRIREAGIKVVLSGEGGDELFLGYPTIHAANIARLYRLLPEFVRRGLIRPATRALPAGQGRLPLAFMAQSFVESDHPDLLRTFFGFKEVVRYADWGRLLTPEAAKLIGHVDPANAFFQYRDNIQGWNLIDGLSYLDLKVFMPGSSFTGNDNAYMSHSVESRVPMMDNDLVDFATRLPVNVRFNPMKLKVLPRRSLPQHFKPPGGAAPGSYKKAGFEIPAQTWLRGGRFRDFLEKILDAERIERTGFFRPQFVRKILDDQLSGRRNNERILQVIMSLTLFLDDAYESV